MFSFISVNVVLVQKMGKRAGHVSIMRVVGSDEAKTSC